MARARQRAPWLQRAAHKYALIRRDPGYPELRRVWDAPRDASPGSPAYRAIFNAEMDAAGALARKYQVAVNPAAADESEATERLDAGDPGRVTAIVNHEWPMACTLNGGHFAPALADAVRPPGVHAGYLVYMRPGDRLDPHEHKPVIWNLQVDIDLARVTYRDIQDLAGEFRALLRRCYPYALRFPRGVPRPSPRLHVMLDQLTGLALPAYTPAPSPRTLSVSVMLAPVTTRHYSRLVREFKTALRGYLSRGGTRSGDPLAWLHTALPRDVARHLRRFDLHWRHGLNFRLIAAWEAGQRPGRPRAVPSRHLRLGTRVRREKSVAESVKLIYRSIYRSPYRAIGPRASTEAPGASAVTASAVYSCPTPGHSGGSGCDKSCPTWLDFEKALRLPTEGHGSGSERLTLTGRLPGARTPGTNSPNFSADS